MPEIKPRIVDGDYYYRNPINGAVCHSVRGDLDSLQIVMTLEKLQRQLAAAREQRDDLRCCGNCTKYPAANDESLCAHYGECAGCDNEWVEECWTGLFDSELEGAK